jgi:hypothetical protein
LQLISRASNEVQAFHILEGGNAMSTPHSKLCYLGLFAFVAACLCAAATDAQPPGKKGKGAKGPPDDAEILTVRGTVKEFTTSPKGEKDGVILTDGTWVHWPPHLENRFGGILAKGDKVRVIGWMDTGKKGESKLEVSSLTNLTTNETATNTGPKDFSPAEKEKDKKDKKGGKGDKDKDKKDGEPVTANGTVKEFTTAKKGEKDGLILSDGQWIHWPPHLSERFSDFVVKGDKVRVTGFKEVDKKGETKVEVSTLTNLRTNKTLENPDRPARLADRATPLDRPIQGKAIDREARIRALEDQVEQLMLELKRLRKEK